MQRFLLGFCGGALAFALPWRAGGGPAGVALLVVAVVLPGLACSRGVAWLRGWRLLVLGLCGGLLWGGAAHQRALDGRLQLTPGSEPRWLQVAVLSAPQWSPAVSGQPAAARFKARVLEPAGVIPAGTQLRLTWYGAPDLARRDRYRLLAAVKGPWSYANPGGFDYERWLLGAGIDGTGYVRQGVLNSRPAADLLESWRGRLSLALERSGLRHRALLAALLTGVSTGVTDQRWQAFRATGTVHLMVISGLHVSLAAGLGFLLGRWLGVLCPLLLLWLNARMLGALLGMVAAGGYVALAGAGLPALRALVMSAAVLGPLALGRSGRTGSALLLGLAAVLLLEPLAVHQQGFWLSFAAVAILLLTLAHRPGRRSWAVALLHVQLALSVAMLPLVGAATGELPWTGIPANLVAVPVMSLAVVPALLLGGLVAPFWPELANLGFWVADAALGLVLGWIDWLSRAPPLRAGCPPLATVAAQAAACWWLTGGPRRHRAVLWPACLLVLSAPAERPAPGEYWITALDVGQGSAVMVDTARHRLLYDTGPRFPGGFDTGRAVVAPSLAASGRLALDVLVLSHEDVDHVGGAGYLLERVPVGRLLTGDSRRRGESCHGRHWRWDGVDLRMLEVARPRAAADNDRSCILLVDNGRERTLLAGDISATVEARLMRVLRGPVRLMFAPHHGSATSSSRALVRLLQPRLVFVSAGYHNRFGHPHPRVAARYRDVGARLLQTGRDGALVWRSDAPERVRRARVDGAPYWRVQDASGGASRR